MSNLFEKPLSRTANSCMQSFRQGRFTMKRNGVENQLRWYLGITATQDRGVGMLPLCEFSENFFAHRRKSRHAGDKPRVPRFQALQGVVGIPPRIRNCARVGGVVAALTLASPTTRAQVLSPRESRPCRGSGRPVDR